MDLKSTTKQRASVEEKADELFDSQSCPGISVAVVDGTETVFAAGYGDRQLDPQKAATPDTLYGIGSSTKPITAMAVMTLVDEGTVSLDDPVDTYLPHFEDAPGDPITVHELLSHTSGMPADDVATHILFESMADFDVDRSLDSWAAFREYVEGSVDRRLLDEQRCLYYNSGYTALSRLVETVTDTSFAEYVDEAVLSPLGMDASTFDVSVLADESRDAMTPYFDRDEEMNAASLPDNPLFEGPGGLQAPVTDLAKFIAAWNERELPVGRTLAERMYDPVGAFRTAADGTEIGYGYGWMTRPFGDDVLVGHGGGTGISAGYLGFLRDRGLGVAIGCNAQPATSPEDLAIELLAAATETEPAAVVWERATETKVAQVTGKYEMYGGLQTATVDWTGDHLEIEHTSPMGGDTVELTPVSPDPDDYRFRRVDDEATKLTAEFFVEDTPAFRLGRTLFERVGDLDEDE
jgi:CubicO group peptidase (beta-lactamase class C family)